MFSQTRRALLTLVGSTTVWSTGVSAAAESGLSRIIDCEGLSGITSTGLSVELLEDLDSIVAEAQRQQIKPEIDDEDAQVDIDR